MLTNKLSLDGEHLGFICKTDNFNTIFFSGPVYDNPISVLLSTLHEQHNHLLLFEQIYGLERKIPLFLVFSSTGGDVDLSLFFINAIKSLDREIFVVSSSIVASAGVYIFLSFDNRYAFKNSYFMLHDILFSMPANIKLSELKSTVLQNEIIFKNLLIEEIIKTKTSFNLTVKDDYYFNTEEAMRYNFFNLVINSLWDIEDYKEFAPLKTKFLKFFLLFEQEIINDKPSSEELDKLENL